jgi:hypothetical protein
VAAIVGVGGTYLAGNRQAKTSLDVARVQGEIQATIARESRNQRRIEAAYTEIIAAIHGSPDRRDHHGTGAR